MRGLNALPLIFLTATGLAGAVGAASCNCGYQDPSTGNIWTDAIITYFNETEAANDIVFQPARSPHGNGNSDSGDSGTGSESWVVAGDQTHKWEEGFTATYRSGFNYNNTFLDGDEQALALNIQPAELTTHLSYGAQIVTRRRDILYGSFRVEMKLPATKNAGSIMQAAAQYNTSATVNVGIYSSNLPENGTFRWSYSATGQDAQPIKHNISLSDADNNFDFFEHRFDWLGAAGITWSNNAPNATQGMESTGPIEHHPSAAVPFSLSHYSNGEKTLSQGPPLNKNVTGYVRHARLFFNSTLESRQSSFVQLCANVPQPLCNTEDLTLRGSTEFGTDAIQTMLVPGMVFKAPKYAVISVTIFAGLFALILLHSAFRRRVTSSTEGDHADVAFVDSQINIMTSASKTSFYEEDKDFETAANAWNTPNLLLKDDNSEDEDEDDDEKNPFDDDDESSLEANVAGFESVDPDARRGHASLATLPTSRSLAHSTHSLESQFPPQTPGGFLSVDGSLSDFPLALQQRPALRMRDTFSTSFQSLNGVNTPGLGTHSLADAGDSASTTSVWQTRIVPWKARKVNDAVGTLAAPAINRGQGQATRGSTVETPSASSSSVAPPKRHFIIRALRSTVAGIRRQFSSPEDVTLTNSGANRVQYLNSIRGLCSFLIMVGNWLAIFQWVNGGTPHNPELNIWLTRLLGWLLAGWGRWKVAMFFLLPSRVIANRYLLKGGLSSLADTTVRRFPRLAIPILFAAAINYFLMEVDAYIWIRRLPSWSWSSWSYYESYKNAGEFVNMYISLWYSMPPEVPVICLRYAIGILWVIPIMIQGTWCVLICALVAHEIKNHYKRYFFYFLCSFFSWYAGRIDLYFLLGFIVADMDNKLNYRKWFAIGVPLFPGASGRLGKIRLHGQIIGWVCLLTGTLLVFLHDFRAPGRYFDSDEFGVKLSFVTANPQSWRWSPDAHPEPDYFDLKFSTYLAVLGFYILCDTCETYRAFFTLRFWDYIADRSMSLFLLHGTIFWSWSAMVTILLASSGVPYWAATLINFVSSMAILCVVCSVFTATIEKWGIQLSTALWRAMSGGLGRKM
ncbi:unnamed protein product [Tilletia controversa]|uniref:Acyltransferase 3 domain-containing protein n=3 Tax=Tilletia TaxID=13289 RepID=A0A8X7MZL2_9BASI|nr:hypothetical protein CF335_g4479 [Tilletia laevis]KAE8200850.1 hypothetical protein CF328_g2849 [Tilletia controversa]KAE8258163.1 hypothetical protein A4X03_0g4464 [Tilletia caries]KAE8198074.1 hypothetical protein CF336_g1861 [Tilletia laevis]KAE8253477.1 hypothetical protein A4X06_0g1423 [Tilletia controversa]